MEKNYTAVITQRTPRPRSKRLREQGIGSSAGATVVMSGASGGTTVVGDGHTHANLPALNEISTDTNGYQYLTQLREVENTETGDTTVEQVTEKVKAGYADEAGEAAHAREAGNADMWDNRQFDDYLDQSVRKTDSVQHKEVITDTLRGVGPFVDGLLGSGYRLWQDANGLTHLTLDTLTVRQTMVILELIIDRIRAVGGQIVVSASSGKIKTVEEVDGYYKISFEQENTFQAHDLMRCQTFTGGTLKSYWVEVSAVAVDGNSVLVETSEFDDSLPAEGDEVVLMGNTEDTKRQNFIVISATEDGQPRIDVMNGVKAKNFTDCLRARLGNLDGIEDPWFPDGVKGDGLYCDNVYLRGKFQFSNHQDLETRFSITDRNIQSSVEALREDFVEEKGFLSNPSFNRGLESWEIDDAAMLYETGQTCIIANSELLSTKESGAALMYDDSRRVMRIKNTSIIQRNAAMRAKPEIVKDTDGIGEPALIHFSVLVKVISAGALTVGFDGETTEGFHSFIPFSQRKDLAQSDSYQMVTMSGVWTGTGDFKFEFSGELYAYNFIITSDPVEAFTYRYKSLFEQSARLTKLAVAAYGKDKEEEREQLMKETGLMITPDGSGIYFRKSDGTIAFISVEEEDGGTVVKITSGNIKLEGLVTANGNFKIDKYGNIEAKDASLDGNLTSSDTEKGNSIVINAKEGFIRMTGPVSLKDDGSFLPSSDKRKTLFEAKFDTDPDTLSRVSTVYIYGPNDSCVRMDPIEGIFCGKRTQDGTLGKGVHITEDGITIRKADGSVEEL